MLKKAVFSKSITKFDIIMMAVAAIATVLAIWLGVCASLDIWLMKFTVESYSKLKVDGIITQPLYESLVFGYVDEWSSSTRIFNYGYYAAFVMMVLFVSASLFRGVYVNTQDALRWLRKVNNKA